MHSKVTTLEIADNRDQKSSGDGHGTESPEGPCSGNIMPPHSLLVPGYAALHPGYNHNYVQKGKAPPFPRAVGSE